MLFDVVIAINVAINAIPREVYHRRWHEECVLRRIAYTMEKIKIQFKESEYEIYYNYCHSYYTVYDSTRKQSIQLFIDLFEKDMLPLEEHDLKEVSSFFSKNSDKLLAEPQVLGENNSLIDLHQFQVSRDIQFLIQDFEKIYRLIEKKGIASNYILILAMFSKIIDEEKIANTLAVDEQDRKTIDFFAPEIAEIIRTRLGSDHGWERVLYELTCIVRKFNLASPPQKISQNALFILASAVVNHVNRFVEPEEIRSTLQKYFEESELTEFESLLKDMPDLPITNTDSDISVHVIFEALISISRRENDLGSHETITVPEPLKIADILPITSPSVISRNSEINTPPSEGTFIQYLKKIQGEYFSRFDIGISDTEKSLVVMPEKRKKPSYNTYKKPGIPVNSLVVVSFIIIILFLIALGPASFIWNPVKPMTNSSTGITNISSPLAKINPGVNLLAPLAKNDIKTVVANKTIFIVPSPTAITQMSSSDINKNFIRIAFGPDNPRIQKIVGERTSVAVMGSYFDSDITIIEQFKEQFNSYSSTNKFVSGIKPGDQASIVITFLPESSLDNVLDVAGSVISRDPKTGDIHFVHRTVTNGIITYDTLFINSDFKGQQRTHWILRALLSELGLRGETDDYSDSIFHSGSENIDHLSDTDWKVVELMYSQKITTGMTFDRVKTLLLV